MPLRRTHVPKPAHVRKNWLLLTLPSTGAAKIPTVVHLSSSSARLSSLQKLASGVCPLPCTNRVDDHYSLPLPVLRPKLRHLALAAGLRRRFALISFNVETPSPLR